MDTELLVDNQIDDGQRLLAQLNRDGFRVTAAFWARTAGEGLWHFYIASPAVDVEKVGDSYRTLYASLRKIPEPWFSLLQVKLIPPQHPLAVAAAALRDRSPGGRLPTRYRGKLLGSPEIEEAYIYPRTESLLTSEEVLQAVAALMNRSGSVPPALVTFRDGSTIRAIPTSVQVRQPGKVEVGFLEVGATAPRIVEASEVVNIQ